MRTRIVLAALAIGASAVGIGIAPIAAGTPSSQNCQSVGGATVCAQGGASSAGQSASPTVPAPPNAGAGGCANAFGVYQNCNVGRG